MDLDALNDVKPSRKNVRCYKCGKKSHKKADCSSMMTGKTNALVKMEKISMLEKSNEEKNQITNDELEIIKKHNNLHWIVCYDDYCWTHYPSKTGAKYFPRAPRKKNLVYAVQ